MAVALGVSPSAPANLRNTTGTIEKYCPLVMERVRLCDLEGTHRPDLDGARGKAIGYGHKTFFTAEGHHLVNTSGAYWVRLDAPLGSDGGVTGLPAEIVRVSKRHVEAATRESIAAF
jgi:hypothetical protein